MDQNRLQGLLVTVEGCSDVGVVPSVVPGVRAIIRELKMLESVEPGQDLVQQAWGLAECVELRSFDDRKGAVFILLLSALFTP